MAASLSVQPGLTAEEAPMPAARVMVPILLVSVFFTVSTAPAADLTGMWRGPITHDEESTDIEVEFSQAGYPLYSYTNNQGVTRQVELMQPGQEIRFVPPGGGVQRVFVESILKQPGSVSLSITGSFEKSSQGYLDQQRESTTIDYMLVPQGLKMRVTSRLVSHIGDKDRIVGGNPNESVAEGILQKVP